MNADWYQINGSGRTDTVSLTFARHPISSFDAGSVWRATSGKPAVAHDGGCSAAGILRMTKRILAYMAIATAWFAVIQAVPCSPGVALAAEHSPRTGVTCREEGRRASCPPLIQAATDCRLEEVQALLAAGADPNDAGDYGRTALHYAVYWACRQLTYSLPSKRMKLVELLVAAGTAPRKTDMWDRTVLHEAAGGHQPDVTKVIELLVAAGADVGAKDKHGYTPLHQTALHRSPEAAKVLLARGAGVNARAERGSSPLIHAAAVVVTIISCPSCDRNSPHLLEVVKVLLASGADVNARTDKGMTALGYALETGKTEVVELLKAHGAKE